MFVDVIEMLDDYAGGYTTWPRRFGPGPVGASLGDAFDVDLRTSDGQLCWPLSEPAAIMLQGHLGALVESELYGAPWDRLPRRLVPATRSLTLEMLVHPGLMRSKGAADALLNAGPIVTAAVTRVLSELLLADATEPVLPDHLVEGALATLGYFRHEAALEVLCELAGPRRSVDVRAEAATSLGDVMAAAGHRQATARLPRHWHRGLDVLLGALDDRSPIVAQAAVRGVAGLSPESYPQLVDGVRGVAHRFPESTLAVQLAEWCLGWWDPALRSQ